MGSVLKLGDRVQLTGPCMPDVISDKGTVRRGPEGPFGWVSVLWDGERHEALLEPSRLILLGDEPPDVARLARRYPSGGPTSTAWG